MTFTAAETARATGGRILAGEDAPARGLSIDTRTLRRGQAFFALVGERVDSHELIADAHGAGAAFLVIHRDVESPEGATLVRVENTEAALADLGAWLRGREELCVVGVTGSVGKTSTKALLAAALEAESSPGSYNTVYGLPLTLANLPEGAERVVLEMGVSEPGEMARLRRIAEPDVMVLLNVAPAHTEALGSVEGVAREKAASAASLRPGAGGVVWNADDSLLESAVREVLPEDVTALRFGESEGADLRLVSWQPIDLGGGRVTARLPDGGAITFELSLPGRHNALNALAALAAGLLLGEDAEAMARRLEGVQPPPGRGRVMDLGGLRVVDDSYNANPRSLEAALALLAGAPAGRKIAVLGDMKELGAASPAHHEAAGEMAARAGVDLLLLVGEEMALAEGPAREGGIADVHRFADAAAAGSWLAGHLREGDLVLVKGSRAMALESVVEALREAAGEEG